MAARTGGFASLSSGGYGGGMPSGGGPGGSYGYRDDPTADIRQAAAGARGAMNTLGVPSWSDFMKQFGGSAQFGNAGMAGAGADFERGQLNDWRNNLTGLRGDIAAREKQGLGPNRFAKQLKGDISEYSDPTKTAAFQAEMGLARESTGAASAQAQRDAAEAAQRRGYAGGYDPRQSDIARMQALSEAGFAGVKDIRDQALTKYGSDVSGYGAQNAANQAKFNTDIGALTDLYRSGMQGYTSANQGFADLTKTQAELPTKWLSAMSGFGGGPESFFHDALNAYGSARDFNAAQRVREESQRAGSYM